MTMEKVSQCVFLYTFLALSWEAMPTSIGTMKTTLRMHTDHHVPSLLSTATQVVTANAAPLLANYSMGSLPTM